MRVSPKLISLIANELMKIFSSKEKDGSINKIRRYDFTLEFTHWNLEKGYDIKSSLKKNLFYELRGQDSEISNIFSDNAIYDTIQQSIKKYFPFNETKVFVIDYNEREGSFIITFGILVIATIASYGAIRQGIDYFKDDIQRIFHKTKPKETNFTFNFREQDISNPVYQYQTTTSSDNSQTYSFDPNNYGVEDELHRNKKISLTNLILMVIVLILTIFNVLTTDLKVFGDSEDKKIPTKNEQLYYDTPKMLEEWKQEEIFKQYIQKQVEEVLKENKSKTNK